MFTADTIRSLVSYSHSPYLKECRVIGNNAAIAVAVRKLPLSIFSIEFAFFFRLFLQGGLWTLIFWGPQKHAI